MFRLKTVQRTHANAGWDRAASVCVAFLTPTMRGIHANWSCSNGYTATHPEVARSAAICSLWMTRLQLAPQDPALGHTRATAVTWHSLLLRHQSVTPSARAQARSGSALCPDVRYMEDYRPELEVAGAGHPIVKLQLELAEAICCCILRCRWFEGDLWPMERAELAVLAAFHHAGKPYAARALLSIYSALLRYLRRRLIVWLR